MSALTSRPPGEATVCHNCGARLAAGQDWCLECGTAANMRIRPAPDWRIPLAIVGGVVALVVIVVVLTVNAASDSANRSVPAVLATVPTVHHHRARAKASSSGLRAGPTVGSWPAGVTGYTVVLAVIHDKAAATSDAKKIALTGVPVGLLFSTDYSSMRPGDWIVFSGTYTSRAGADTAATALKGRGQPGAYAFSVVPAAGAGTASTTPGPTTTPGATTTSP